MDLEDTQQLPLPYVLTDGRTIAEVRFMSTQEFEQANERALIASGSAWEWVSQTAAHEIWE